jgi:protoporphyrinogen oxidase
MISKLKSFDVVVLGAGVSGLACADEILRNKNGRVLVIEKNKHWGGLASTIKYKNFLFDLAPHRWFTKNEELNRWIDDLMGSELIWVRKNTPMYQFGKFFAYPIKIMDVLTKINFGMAAFMLVSYVYEKGLSRIKPRKVVTMKDAYISKFGWGLYQWFNKEYNEKLWGEGGCEAVSADFVNQRVKNLSMTTAITNALGFNKNKVISLVEKFRYPRMGIGRIGDNLVKRIKGNGGTICLDEAVTEIIKNKVGYKVVTTKGEYFAKSLISSIPVEKLITSLKGVKSDRIKKEVSKLKYVDQKIVVLLVKERKLTPYTWVYVHPKAIRSFRFMETNNWSKAMSPKGMDSLIFEYPCQDSDRAHERSDAELVKITIDDFYQNFALGRDRRKVIKGLVFWVPNAYPVYDFTYERIMRRVYKFVDLNLPSLQLIGRNGMFHYNNLDHSIYTGILAARNYLRGGKVYDLTRVNNEAEYLEEIKKGN